MTGAGAGCAGPVQSYPASWPNSHYYQGGATSRYLLSILDIYYIFYSILLDIYYLFIIYLLPQSIISALIMPNVWIYLVWCPLAAVHDRPGPRRGDGRYRPGLRAAADRLHPGQHDGGHGGGLYHMPYVYVMKSWQDYVPEMMAASGFRQAVMGRYPLETVTSLPEYSGLDPDFWEDRRGCGATGQQEDACSGSPIFFCEADL